MKKIKNLFPLNILLFRSQRLTIPRTGDLGACVGASGPCSHILRLIKRELMSGKDKADTNRRRFTGQGPVSDALFRVSWIRRPRQLWGFGWEPSDQGTQQWISSPSRSFASVHPSGDSYLSSAGNRDLLSDIRCAGSFVSFFFFFFLKVG